MQHAMYHSQTLPTSTASTSAAPTPAPSQQVDSYERALLTVALAEAAVGAINSRIASRSPFPEKKPDGSWVTGADKDAHKLLAAELHRMNGLPVISEEGVPQFSLRHDWQSYWLIDPLDNTSAVVDGKQQLARVNIVLFEQGEATLAVVSELVGGKSLIAIRGVGVLDFIDSQLIAKQIPYLATDTLRFVAYKGNVDMMAQDTAALYRALGVQDAHIVDRPTIAQRFEGIFSGAAHVYIEPRRISAWDVAPYLLACEELGCKVRSLASNAALTYNSPDMRLDPFVVVSAKGQEQALLDRLCAVFQRSQAGAKPASPE
jgi:3'(2'), 5'-bisphosphate nucleotidase